MGSETRLNKYLRKLDYLNNALSFLDDWINNTPKDVFLTDAKTRYASYKAFQEAVEAAMDICAMITKDEGKLPKDDYTNIETLAELNIISGEIAEKLKEANALRNWVIHRYNKLDDERAYDRIKELIDPLNKFAEEVERWLEKKF